MAARKIPVPAYLQQKTCTWFSEVLKDYELEPHHVRLLTLAAEAWDRCQEARKILGREGLTFTDRFSAPRVRPEVAVERDSRLAFARLLRELALDVEEPDEMRPPRLMGNAQLRKGR